MTITIRGVDMLLASVQTILIASVVFGVIGGVSSLLLTSSAWGSRLSHVNQLALRLTVGGIGYVSVLIIRPGFQIEGAVFAFLVAAGVVTGSDYLELRRSM